MTTCCGYIRVTQEEMARKGISMDAQKQMIIDYCNARKYSIYKIYEEPGRKGDDPTRPEFNAMLKDAIDKKFDMLIVFRLDRLFRDPYEGLKVTRNLQAQKINLDINAPGDAILFNTLSYSADDELFMILKMALARHEIRRIAQRNKLVEDKRAKEGRNFKRPPIGYIVNNKKLIIDKYRAGKVREIFEKVATGEEVKNLAEEYNIAIRMIYRIIKNRTYLGELLYQGKWIKATHSALVDNSLFEKAGSKIKKRSSL